MNYCPKLDQVSSMLVISLALNIHNYGMLPCPLYSVQQIDVTYSEADMGTRRPQPFVPIIPSIMRPHQTFRYE